jgi:hypothetical protein
MKVSIDGKEVAADAHSFLSLKEVFDYHKERLGKENRMIYKIEGESGQLNPAELFKYAVKEVKEVSFSTKTKEQLLKDALKEIVFNLPGLAKELSEVILSFRNGDEKKGQEQYFKILPLLNTVLMGLRAVEIGINEDFKIDYIELSNCLKNINQSFENKDYVFLADSLEYVLLPWLKKMSEAIVPKVK